MSPIQQARANEIANATVAFAPMYGYIDLDPALVYAQAVHESGNFTSALIADTNNTFGMKHPTRRPTRSLGAGRNNYATYATLSDSVEDYFMRQRNFGIPDTADAAAYMAATVASGYAEDPAYIGKWAETYDPVAWSTDLDPVVITREQGSDALASGGLLLLLVVGGALYMQKR